MQILNVKSSDLIAQHLPNLTRCLSDTAATGFVNGFRYFHELFDGAACVVIRGNTPELYRFTYATATLQHAFDCIEADNLISEPLIFISRQAVSSDGAAYTIHVFTIT